MKYIIKVDIPGMPSNATLIALKGEYMTYYFITKIVKREKSLFQKSASSYYQS